MSWTPESTVITTKGLEMLSKAEAGIGRMEITKVVTTDTISTVTANRNLTGDSTQITYKQECEIMNAYGGTVYDGTENDNDDTKNTGETRITARVSNEGIYNSDSLIQPYAVQQLIVFMKLTQLTNPTEDMGEIPYMVAQSVGTPDYMPDFNENPVAINYDLYVLHSGVLQITVKNDVTGYTPKETFDGVIKEIRAQIKDINDTKAGENTEHIETFKPWTPNYNYDMQTNTMNWSKVSTTTAVTGKKTAERFNLYGSAESNIAVGENSHAENKDTVALADNSHAEGEYNHISAFSPNTHVEGSKNAAYRGSNQHIEGSLNQAFGANTHVEGSANRANVSETTANIHIGGSFNLVEAGNNHHVTGFRNKVSGGIGNDVKGSANTVSGNYNFVVGGTNTVKGIDNIVGGSGNQMSDDSSNCFENGELNSVYSSISSLISGKSNNVIGLTRTILTGLENETNNIRNCVMLGTSNILKNSDNTVLCGNGNSSTSSANNSVISGISNIVNNSSNSVVSGDDNNVSDTAASIISGHLNVVAKKQVSPQTSISTQHSLVMGSSNNVEATVSSIIFGNSVVSSLNTNCLIFGNTLRATGNNQSIICGHNTDSNFVSSVTNTLVMGDTITLSDVQNSIFVGSILSRGETTDVIKNSICVGEVNHVSASDSGAFGSHIGVDKSNSFALGLWLSVDGSNQVVVGKYNVSTDTESSFIVGTGNGVARRNAFWVNGEYSNALKFRAMNGFYYGDGKEVKQVIDEKIDALINGAPGTRDTLKELNDALEDANDVIEALQTYSVKKKNIPQSTMLISSSGICTWTINHGLPFEFGPEKTGGYIIQITDYDGNVVQCNVKNENNKSIAKFSSTSNIDPYTYKAIVIGSINAE